MGTSCGASDVGGVVGLGPDGYRPHRRVAVRAFGPVHPAVQIGEDE